MGRGGGGKTHGTVGKGCNRVQKLTRRRRRGVSPSFQISKVTTKKAGLPLDAMLNVFDVCFLARFCGFQLVFTKHLPSNLPLRDATARLSSRWHVETSRVAESASHCLPNFH